MEAYAKKKRKKESGELMFDDKNQRKQLTQGRFESRMEGLVRRVGKRYYEMKTLE